MILIGNDFLGNVSFGDDSPGCLGSHAGVIPQTVLALRGSHGVALVPGISCTLWSGSTAEPPRTSALDKCSGS